MREKRGTNRAAANGPRHGDINIDVLRFVSTVLRTFHVDFSAAASSLLRRHGRYCMLFFSCRAAPSLEDPSFNYIHIWASGKYQKGLVYFLDFGGRKGDVSLAIFRQYIDGVGKAIATTKLEFETSSLCRENHGIY